MTEPAVPPARSSTPSGPDLAAAVAATVLAHPSVLRLDGGPFGSIASHLPGRRIAGVRVGGPDEPTEVAVVVRLDGPLAELADGIAARVRAVLGPVPVDVTFSDIGAVGPQPPAPTAPGGLA